MLRTQNEGRERMPPRLFGFTQQHHVGFLRKAIPFFRVTHHTGTDHVFPSGLAPSIPWQDVIEIQFPTIWLLAAILAGMIVALKYVLAAEFHFLLGQPVKAP